MRVIAKLLCSHLPKEKPEVPPLPSPTHDYVELQVLQSFDRELQARFRSLEVDADVIIRRRTRSAGR